MNEEKTKKFLLAAILHEEFASPAAGALNTAQMYQLASPPPPQCLDFFMLILFDDQHIRMPGFNEQWINRYLEVDFYNHFRMRRHTFGKLMEIIRPNFKVPSYRGGASKPLSLEKALQMTLWYLSKGCTMVTVAERFNVCGKTVYEGTTKIIDILNNISSNIIM